MLAGTGNVVDELNRSMPAASRPGAKLGDLLAEIITKHNAVCAKLDADAGVTDTNYTALHSIVPLASR